MKEKKRFEGKKVNKEDNKFIENVANGARVGLLAVGGVGLFLLKKLIGNKL